MGAAETETESNPRRRQQPLGAVTQAPSVLDPRIIRRQTQAASQAEGSVQIMTNKRDPRKRNIPVKPPLLPGQPASLTPAATLQQQSLYQQQQQNNLYNRKGMALQAPQSEPPQTKKAISHKDPRLRRLHAVPRSSTPGSVQEDQLMDIIKNPSRLTVPVKEARPVPEEIVSKEPVTQLLQKPAHIDQVQPEPSRHPLPETLMPVRTVIDTKEAAQSSMSVDIEKVKSPFWTILEGGVPSAVWILQEISILLKLQMLKIEVS